MTHICHEKMWECHWLLVMIRILHESRENAIGFALVTCIFHEEMMWQRELTVISTDGEFQQRSVNFARNMKKRVVTIIQD